MLENPETWVAVAFILFVALAAKPAYRAITGGLDARAEAIRNEIESAEQLREEAHKLLAEYKRKQRDAIKEAEAIVEHSQEEIDRLKVQAAEELKASLARREQGALEKIAQAEAAALQEVRAQVVEVALAATGRLIAENLDQARAGELIDEAIATVKSRLN